MSPISHCAAVARFSTGRPQPYLAWKQAKVVEALSREGLHADFAPVFATKPGSRRRLALHARKGERGGGPPGL